MEAHQDYRQILKSELDNRCEQNPRYSLRAFARDLSLSPSRLSEILNYKQGVSRKAAEKIAVNLGYRESEVIHFCDLVSVRHARSVREKQDAHLRLLKKQVESKENKTFQLQLDAFKIISDWYHIGILELMKLNTFKPDAKWIARRLGISPIQIELAIDRLLRVGLLKRTEDGRLEAIEVHGWIPGGIPSESIRKFHKQVLTKALEALSTQPVNQRHFQTHLFALNKDEVAEASKEMERFQNHFRERFESDGKKDKVYCIAMQLFKIAEEGV
ncbi:MAG: TIGR02147 family protein [Pseudobacteriovorax sp.]|nr:TIGR02147 family protein [Pseudobacteriovorax sp.]